MPEHDIHLDCARQVLQTEIDGLIAVRDQLGDAFRQLVGLCLDAIERGGKLVLTGVGKSGHIGHKVAATLASTGSPAAFLHPVEAMHGDLGIIGPTDLLVCLSYSGETDELLEVLPAAKRFQVPIVALTGVVDSRLAQWSDLVVPMPVPREACPFNLAPTTSTTAMLALGDALAMTLMQAHRFSREDYGLRHPSGSIGRSLALRVRDIMRGPDRTPQVPPETSVKDALVSMTQCRSGSVLVVDEGRRLLGIFTDGDFRRLIQQDLRVLDRQIGEVMTPDPTVIEADQLAVAVLKVLEEREIDDFPVVDGEGRVAGLVDIQDLPKFKLM